MKCPRCNRENWQRTKRGQQCLACGCHWTEEEFVLQNQAPVAKVRKFFNHDRTKQGKLIEGLDCLPGQLDLF